jgi:hypothetical protein
VVTEIRTSQHRAQKVPAAAYPEWKKVSYQGLLDEMAEASPVLPDLPSLIQQAKAVVSTPIPSIESPQRQVPTQAAASPTKSIASRESSPLRASSVTSQPAAQSPQAHQPATTLGMPPPSGPPSRPPVTFAPTSISPQRAPPNKNLLSIDGDDFDSISDNLSHMSMEGASNPRDLSICVVNTTGTGSNKGDLDLDTNSEFSAFSDRPGVMATPPHQSMNPTQPGGMSAADTNALMDELDAELAKSDTQFMDGPGSSTGDAELDELLNL